MFSIARACAMPLAAVGLLVALPAGAQNQPADTPAEDTPAANISDQKLDATAAAVKKISAIATTYEQKIAEAPNADDKERISNEAGDAVAKAVSSEGLSLEEYKTIMTVARLDPVVREKLLQRLK